MQNLIIQQVQVNVFLRRLLLSRIDSFPASVFGPVESPP